jgi:chromosome segregation ATPase
MATLEERVQALEQENTARKKTEELLTITVRALVSKEAFEKLQETLQEAQEQNGKLFNVLINQGVTINNRITDQYTELDGKITGLDGKITGLQTEMRQRFTTVETSLTEHTTVLNEHTTVLNEHTTLLTGHTALLTEILARLPKKP